MADVNARIEQFRKMADADPDNELGHFSLGRAYLEAEMPDAAIASFQRVIDLNPNISRAYELMATALLQKEKKPEAIDFLTRGLHIAQARGDVLPRNQMIKMLEGLGGPVPQLEKLENERPVSEEEVLCTRCNRIGKKLPKAPMRNALGQQIFEKVCATCWREWIGMGTKVINELRLPLSDPQANKIYDQHMVEFLNLTPPPTA